MPYFDTYVRAPASSTDNAVMRFDGTDGQQSQDSDQTTLTDAEILTLAPSAAQVVIAGTSTTITALGVPLSPHVIVNQSSGTDPTMGMVRNGGAASPSGVAQNAAPGFNFFRNRGGGVVQNGDWLGVFTGSGHDGTDYASGAEINMVVDEADSGTAAVGANQMGTLINFKVSPRLSQTPAVALTIRHDKNIQLAATAMITIPNTGLHVLDTDASHDLIIVPGSDLTADRTLTFVTGDADKTLTLPIPLTDLATQAANTVVAEATGSAATPTAVAMAASTILARLATGNIVAATRSEIATLLGLVGVHWHFFNSTPQAATTNLRFVGGAGLFGVVPVGWKFNVMAMSMHSPTVGGAAQTCTAALWSGGSVATIADNSGSFGTLQISTGTDPIDDCEPTSPPFTIDATSARQVVVVKVTNSATTGTVVVGVSVFGYMWKP